jgi:hypothetical protein
MGFGYLKVMAAKRQPIRHGAVDEAHVSLTERRSKPMSEQTSQAPIKEFRSGRVKAAIWRNDVVQDGRSVVKYTVRIQKSFQDKQTQQWKTTDYFFPDELPRLALVAQKAYEYTAMPERGETDVPPAAE